MNVLVTGINGFSGSHLAELLVNEVTTKVYGTIRGRCRQTSFIDKIKESLILLECDFTDYNSIQATLEDSQPDVIYHLGAQTFVPTSWRAPQETFNTNVIGTLNLLEAVRKSSFNPKMLIAGSSEEYGLVYEEEIPIKETNQLRPLSPYAVSKVAQDLLGYQYFKSYGMRIVRTRAFNLIGPRSGEKIVSANFAKQIVKAERLGKTCELETGNLDSVRDFNDVRDIVCGYMLSTSECKDGEVYNISTGEGHKISEIIECYKSMTKVDIQVKNNPNRDRPSDVPILIGDSTKFREATGWSPEFDFHKSLEDVLEYWRSQ
jgi:GDP-4-dehydro-6-deoxy-D-mannose reductase